MKIIRKKLSQTFCFPYFIHAGMLDAITTIIALHSGFSELNPFVASLYPNYVIVMPALLISLAYARSLTVGLFFKNKKYFRPVRWFTLYFPGLFNMAGLIFFYIKPEFANCCLRLAVL